MSKINSVEALMNNVRRRDENYGLFLAGLIASNTYQNSDKFQALSPYMLHVFDEQGAYFQDCLSVVLHGNAAASVTDELLVAQAAISVGRAKTEEERVHEQVGLVYGNNTKGEI